MFHLDDPYVKKQTQPTSAYTLLFKITHMGREELTQKMKGALLTH